MHVKVTRVEFQNCAENPVMVVKLCGFSHYVSRSCLAKECLRSDPDPVAGLTSDQDQLWLCVCVCVSSFDGHRVHECKRRLTLVTQKGLVAIRLKSKHVAKEEVS